MKTITLVLLVCASAFGAELTSTNVTGDLTTVLTEYMTKDGWSSGRSKAMYRGTAKIFDEFIGWTRLGEAVVQSRSYFVDGCLVMRERLNLISVYHCGTTNVEIFRRAPDGAVAPVTGDEFQSCKKAAELEDLKISNLIRDAEADKSPPVPPASRPRPQSKEADSEGGPKVKF